MSKKFIIFVALFLFVFSGTVLASTGTYAMSFTELVDTPYSAALANTVTAVDNPSALFINPAGLGIKYKRQLSAQLFEYIDDIEYKQFQMIQPYFYGNMALSYTWLDYGDYQQTTLTDKEGDSTESISNKGTLLQLSYAKQVNTLKVGLSVKYVEEVLASYKAKTVAFDMGIQKPLKENVNIGASISNLSIAKAKFLNDQASLRRIARVGIQYLPSLLKDRVTILTDYVYLEHRSLLSYATIIKLHQKLSVRVGTNQLSDLFNLSLGVGFNSGLFNVDVSYKNVTYFSDIYRVQLSVRY